MGSSHIQQMIEYVWIPSYNVLVRGGANYGSLDITKHNPICTCCLIKKDYNPIVQLTGYILTEDPTYITNYHSARSLISRIKKEELLSEIVSYYFESTESK